MENQKINQQFREDEIALIEIQYDADGEITTLSTDFGVDFNDLFLLAQAMDFGMRAPRLWWGHPDPSFTSHAMNYTCGGNTLTIDMNQYADVTFDRVNE